MKRTIFIKAAGILSLTGILVTNSGCKKFLEKEPDNRAQIDTPEKISQLLATAYPQANYAVFAESISDNVSDKGSGQIDPTNTDPFYFRDPKGSTQDLLEDTPEFYWFGCYTAIAAANQALDAMKQLPDQTLLKAQRGEALVARAYSHFMLVNFFSKFYNESTASTDVGIPYVTEPETEFIKKYDR
ncbi:MAG: RagB/SusD family nutrient uptake outer membrane protein, partial [Bacteroidota bacterium]